MEYTRIIPEGMEGKLVPATLREVSYDPERQRAKATAEVSLGPGAALLVDTYLYSSTKSMDIMKVQKFREMFNDFVSASDQAFIEEIESWADLENKHYSLEIVPKYSKGKSNAYFVLKEFQCGNRDSRSASPEEKYRNTVGKLMKCINVLEHDRDAAVEENQRLRGTLASLQMDYAELRRAYSAEVRDANYLRERLGIPTTRDNLIRLDVAM